MTTTSDGRTLNDTRSPRRLPHWGWLLVGALFVGVATYGLEFWQVNAALRDLEADSVEISWARRGPG